MRTNEVVHESCDTVQVKTIALKEATSPHPVDRKWCPTAKCFDSANCRPCQRRFLIVIATGRSASTTLTWMLDALPGVRMSGENNDVLKHIHSMIDGTAEQLPFKRQRQDGEEKNSWSHNVVPEGAFACVAQKMIETINPPVKNETYLEMDEELKIIGFKTIRLQNGVKLEALPEIVKFINESFPCARIIVNIRSEVDLQAKSQIITFTTFKGQRLADKVKDLEEEKRLTDRAKALEEENEKLKRIAQLFGNRAKLMDSSEWTTDVNRLNQVVGWLGFHKSCNFTKLLEFNTGRGGYDHGVTKLRMNPECRYVGE